MVAQAARLCLLNSSQARGLCHFIVFILVPLAGCSSLKSVKQELQSPEWQVRRLAVGKLADYRGNDEAAALLLKAMDDPVPRVREGASDALAQLTDGTPNVALLDLASNASDNTKLALIAALDKSGPQQAATPFLTSLLLNQPAAIRLAAAKALHTSADPAKRPPLLAIWTRNEAEELRIAALVSASYPATDARKDPNVIREYREIAGQQPDLMRNPKILAALGDLRIAEAGPRLLQLMADPELKYLAVESLGKMRCTEAVPGLLDLLLKNESWVMNRQVCHAIGRIRPKDAAGTLVRLFLESKPDVDRDSWDRTLFITLAMMKIGGDDVFEAFASQLTSDTHRDFALLGLHRMTGARVVWRENEWLYSWEQIQRFWRVWWTDNKEKVAAKLEKNAAAEDN